MHIRIDYRNGGKRHIAYCSEYHKGKARNPKCHSPHIMDADLLMQTDQTKKQQKRVPQIRARLEQIEKVLDKLYEDNALGTTEQDRYEQMSRKYSEEYYTLKTELAEIKEQLSASLNAGGRRGL
jgi:site-specific DNA recombinase